jgi:hypothetical protein
MALSVKKNVWMGDEWNWLTIVTSSGLIVRPVGSNMARQKKSEHFP